MTEYNYPIAQCDVHDKELLETFRQKRREWLDQLSGDEHHAIASLLSSMAWNDVAFRVLSYIAERDPASALYNPLLSQALIEGHFASQVLAIRRLMDRNRGTISLWRLVNDVKSNAVLFTRENFVAYDGLPYDYAQAEQRVMLAHVGRGAFWGAQKGPDAWIPSLAAHEIFDRLAGIDPSRRQRDDRIPTRIFEKLVQMLDDSGAEPLVEWSHTFLAHAAGREKRERIDIEASRPTLEKITDVLRIFVRVSEALSAYVIHASGHGMIVPVPQFNQFERMNSPLSRVIQQQDLMARWESLAEERNKYLEGTLEALLGEIAGA